MYPRIMIEIASTHWAITEQALRGICKAAEGVPVDAMNRDTFHAADEDDRQAIVFLLGEPVEDGNEYTAINGEIGSLLIDGPIIPRSSSVRKSSGLVSIEMLSSEFKALEANPDVREIVLFMDTPGGAVKGVSEFARLVSNSTKPTTAFVFGLAASAGYWIASAADRIISSDTGIVGSIGVVQTVRLNDENRFVEIVSPQSPNKRIDPSSKKGRAEIEALLRDLADVFIDAVAENRNVSPATVVEKFGKGGVVAAGRAKDLGMIDGIADLGTMIDDMKAGVSFDSIVEASLAAAQNDEENTENDRAAVREKIDRVEIDEMDEKEKEKMDLKTAIQENPEFAAEIEQIKADSVEEGRREMRDLYERTAKFVGNDDYPETVDTIAKRVLSGEESLDKLLGAVAAVDAMKAKDSEVTAEEEAVEDTPAETPPTLSADGIVKNEDDYQAAIDRVRRMESN